MDISYYHSCSIEDLKQMSTRELMTVRSRAFNRRTCGCHNASKSCGDEVLSAEDRDFNLEQYALQDRVKQVLSTREHIPNKREAAALRAAAAKRGR